MALHSNTDLPAKRKHTTNPKLLDGDNISQDAIKHRKMEASKTSSLTTASTSKSSNLDITMSSKTSSPRQASVETVADENNTTCHNAGQPTNPNIIIESTDEEDDIYSQHTAKKQGGTGMGIPDWGSIFFFCQLLTD